jgi:hypothetical protein
MINMDASLVFFVLFLLLAVGAAASPFNKFLRFMYFSDGYRWRGFDRQDTVPLAKTVVLTCAFAAGAAYGGLTFFHKAGTVSNIFAGALIAGVFGTLIFSIWHALGRGRRARRHRRESHR